MTIAFSGWAFSEVNVILEKLTSGLKTLSKSHWQFYKFKVASRIQSFQISIPNGSFLKPHKRTQIMFYITDCFKYTHFGCLLVQFLISNKFLKNLPKVNNYSNLNIVLWQLFQLKHKWLYLSEKSKATPLIIFENYM